MRPCLYVTKNARVLSDLSNVFNSSTTHKRIWNLKNFLHCEHLANRFESVNTFRKWVRVRVFRNCKLLSVSEIIIYIFVAIKERKSIKEIQKYSKSIIYLYVFFHYCCYYYYCCYFGNNIYNYSNNVNKLFIIIFISLCVWQLDKRTKEHRDLFHITKDILRKVFRACCFCIMIFETNVCR